MSLSSSHVTHVYVGKLGPLGSLTPTYAPFYMITEGFPISSIDSWIPLSQKKKSTFPPHDSTIGRPLRSFPNMVPTDVSEYNFACFIIELSPLVPPWLRRSTLLYARTAPPAFPAEVLLANDCRSPPSLTISLRK